MGTVGGLRRFVIPRTLAARLVAASAGSLLLAILAFTGATIALVGTSLRGSLDSALRNRAQEVAQLAVSAPAVLTDPGALESPVSTRQLAVEVIDARGRILARSLTLGARLLPQDALALRARAQGATGFEGIEIAGRRLRMYAAPIAQAGGPAAGGAVLVASETTDIAQTVHHLAFVLALAGAGIAVLGGIAAAGLTRRGLRPLPALIAAAEEIERTADPDRRLPQLVRPRGLGAPPAAEFVGLTGVLNRMLGSLARSRASERRFLADASHELRTPVTTLLGNVEYAARHGVDEELLADLRRDASRLARLVDDLLTVEREGGAEPQLAPVALERLVADLIEELDRDEDRIELVCPEPVRVRVLGEEESLRRAVRNLIENALVHGPPRGTVTVAIHRTDAHAQLTVSDQGQGPDPAMHERMFERFWRGPDASERPGSGLGLSIVSAIVRRHGGKVAVEGATFTVELPLA